MAIYYVSSTDGSDSDSGLSESLAWQTLSKVNGFTFASGDQILFKCGDTFLGSLTANRSTMTYGAYGTGDAPIISGFQTLSSWADQGGGIWRATTTATTSCNMVTLDGVSKAMGRWPKTGWLTMTTSTSNTSFTDNELPASPSWTGAQVVIKKNNWTIDRSAITNHSGTTITYTSGSAYSPVAVEGLKQYFMQKSLTTLSQTGTTLGEWYCDGTYMYMYFGVEDPTTYVVKAAVVTNIITITSKSAVTIQDLTIEGANADGITTSASSSINITNCTVQFSGDDGIAMSAHSTSNTNVIDGCTVTDSNNRGIWLQSSASTIKNSTITNSGMLVGMGPTNGDGLFGINMISTGGLIEKNIVTNSGYTGIKFYLDSFIVRYNVVDGCCSLITDGAGIYIFIGTPTLVWANVQVYNNIVLNSGANGLYNDNSANHVEWHHNTVINAVKSGMHMNDIFNGNIHDNTFYNCITGFSIQNLYMSGGTCHDNTIGSNIVVQKSNTQRMTSLIDARTFTVNGFGTSDNNTFVVESSGLDVHKAEWVLPSYALNLYTFTEWKAFVGKELASVLKTTTLADLMIGYNDTDTAKDVTFPFMGFNLDGVQCPAVNSIQPYSSLVLIKNVLNPAPPDSLQLKSDTDVPLKDNAGMPIYTVS